jgi:PAS domain S-box-containing protein
VTVTNSDPTESERNPSVLPSLSTLVEAVQKAEDSENICSILSSELTACGIQHIVLSHQEARVKIACVGLPSQVTEAAEALSGISLEEREFPLDGVPFHEKIMEQEIIFTDSKQVLSSVLGVPVSSLGEPLPRSTAVIPLVEKKKKNQILLVILSDELKEEELPFLSAFKEVVETAINNVYLLREAKMQKEFSERIIRSVQEGILMEDAEGIITFVNPRLQQMLGYTEEELLGRHYSVIACPEFITLAEEESRKRPKGIQSKYEACLLKKDGTTIPVLVSATPLLEEGAYTGTLTVFTDISSQKGAEEEIRILKEFNENIIQSMHEAVIIEDAKGMITFVNRKLIELLEREPQEIVGHHWKEFTAPEFIQKVEEESTRRVHGISGQYEAALQTKNGRRVPIMVGSTPFFEDNRFKGVISVCVDLTVIKEKENEIKQMNEDLQLLSKINHALNIGEDLKTILDMAIQEVQRIFNADAMAIMFVENGKRIWSENFAVSPVVRQLLNIGERTPPVSFTLEKGSLLEKTVKKGESHLVHGERLERIYRRLLSPEVVEDFQKSIHVHSAAVFPLVVEDEVTGVMMVGSRKELSQNDFKRLKSLSKHLALAIDHAQLDETFQKTSEDLQTHLKEQTLLRELVEKLYIAGNQEEVISIVAEGLKALGYDYFGVTIREEDDCLKLVHVQPKDILKRVEEVVKKTGKTAHVEKIPLPKDKFSKQGKKRAAFVTDNILLQKEKNVIFLSMKDFIQTWVGTDAVAEQVSQIVDIQSLICISFQVAEEFVGVFAVGSRAVLTHHDFVVLETLGQIISQALGKLQYSEALEKKSQDLEFSNRQLNLLQEITNALNSTMDLGEILRILVRGISSVFGYNTPSVYLLSDDGEHLLVKEFDINSRLLEGITKLVGFNLEQYRIPLFEGSQLKKVLNEKKPLITSDIPRFLEDYTEEAALRRMAGALYRMGNVNWVTALPLMAGDEPVGMLVFGSKKKIEQEDINALRGFLDQAVQAIHKARLYEQLAEANQMKSEFIDVASHELRTPLTSIKLYLEMIKMGRYGELSSELEEKIGLLQASAQRLQDIIDQTLVSSRIIKEKLDFTIDELSLVKLIKDVVAQLRPLWEAKRQRIDVHGPYKLPLVKGDIESLWKVVTALLDNAIKYSPEESRVTVKIYNHPEEVEVVIIDEGVGIQQEYQQKIFDEFYIVPSESEYARMDGRTGLGLFIAKGIVEGHKGKIWVESVYGLGSTFHFTLPK